jgi:hypothetical protein
MSSRFFKFQVEKTRRSAQGFFKVLFIICLLTLSGFAASLQKTIEADLDFDGRTERITINADNIQTLKISHGRKILWQGVPARWKPWKMEIADVDGDGRREIIVGVFKSTKFFPKPHNCLFVYGFSFKRAFPKWLGSALGRAFMDFTFIDLDGEKGDELIALETTLEGKTGLSQYKWNGFGFTLESRQGEWQTARILGETNGSVSIEADGQKFYLTNKEAR